MRALCRQRTSRRAVVQYLIDGNNLLHATHHHGPCRPIGRVTLCQLVDAWARLQGVSLTIIFDGTTPRKGLVRQMESPQVAVEFAGPRTADAAIEEKIARCPDPGSLTVITTDRAVRHATCYRGAQCIRSEDFASELTARPLKPAPPPPEPPEKPETVSPDEAERWLRTFGAEPDGGRAEPD